MRLFHGFSAASLLTIQITVRKMDLSFAFDDEILCTVLKSHFIQDISTRIWKCQCWLAGCWLCGKIRSGRYWWKWMEAHFPFDDWPKQVLLYESMFQFIITDLRYGVEENGVSSLKLPNLLFTFCTHHCCYLHQIILVNPKTFNEKNNFDSVPFGT